MHLVNVSFSLDSYLFQTFLESVLPTFIDPTKYSHRCIGNYTSSCVDLTWSMCVQDPPMVFIDKLDRGADFNTDYFRKFTRNGGDKFDYLVWPAIRLYKNGPLVVKGIAEPIKTVKNVTPENENGNNKTPEVHKVPSPVQIQSDRRFTPPVTDRPARKPEDWVDLDMNSEDNNSWDRDLPETPNKVYKRNPENSDVSGLPTSPYFAPYSNRSSRNRVSNIPTIRVTENTGDGTRGRYARSQGGRSLAGEPGNLTVMWTNKQTAQDRRTTAP